MFIVIATKNMSNEDKIIATLKRFGNQMCYQCLADKTFGNDANSQRANHVGRDSNKISISIKSKCLCSDCSKSRLRHTAYLINKN